MRNIYRFIEAISWVLAGVATLVIAMVVWAARKLKYPR